MFKTKAEAGVPPIDIVYVPQTDFGGRRLLNIRGQECGGLKYSLRSVEKNAPWINRIYVVSSEPAPEWLDLSNPKIKFLRFSDFVEEKYLETANAKNIVFHLHNIEELSEHFIVANEDMYFGAPVKKSDFFTDDEKIICRAVKLEHHKENMDKGLNYIKTICSDEDKNTAYTNLIVYRKTGVLPNLAQSPNIATYKISTMKKYMLQYDKDVEKALLNENEDEFVLLPELFSYAACCEGDAKIKYIDSLQKQKERFERSCLSPLRLWNKPECLSLYLGSAVTNQNPMLVTKEKPKFFLFHPLPDVHTRQAELAQKALKKLFPFPSSFEKENFIHICFSTNNEYTKHCAASIASIVENCTDRSKLRFHVLHNNLSQENIRRLQKTAASLRCNVETHNINFEDFKDCKIAESSYFTVETYFRLKLPDILKDVDKIIYIDCDTTVLGDVFELWETEPGQNYLAACQDPTQPAHLREDMGDDIYFNAGVIVINAKLWRRDNIVKTLFDFLAENPEKIVWVDQDALNAVLHGKIKFLPANWNVMYNPYYDKLSNLFDDKDIKIIHHVSRYKPWNTYTKHKYAKYYFKYLAKTDWKYLAFKIPLKLMIIRYFNRLYNFILHRRYIKEFEQSIRGRKAVLWGASVFASNIVRFFGLKTESIVGVIDRDESKRGKKLGRYKIYNPAELKSLNADLIISTVINHPNMGEYIKKELVNQKLDIEVWENCFDRLKETV